MANFLVYLNTTQAPAAPTYAPPPASTSPLSASTAPAAGASYSAQTSQQPAYTAPAVQNSALLSQLDGASLNALADVKNTLNLSSEIEALRALIALGYKQFKKI